MLGALAPDIRWTEAEGFPYGGTYVGPDAILQGVFMRLGTEWDGYAAVVQRALQWRIKQARLTPMDLSP